MRPLPLISTALFLTVALTSCTDNASEVTVKANIDTTTTPGINTADDGREKLEANKKLVTDFYQSLYGDKDSTAIDKYIADNIKQHNPLLKDGKEWFKGASRVLLTSETMSEKRKIDIKQIVAEDDMVWILVQDVAPNKKVFARVEIFRIDNGKIAENWKIAEPVSEKSVNSNTPF